MISSWNIMIFVNIEKNINLNLIKVFFRMIIVKLKIELVIFD